MGREGLWPEGRVLQHNGGIQFKRGFKIGVLLLVEVGVLQTAFSPLRHRVFLREKKFS